MPKHPPTAPPHTQPTDTFAQQLREQILQHLDDAETRLPTSYAALKQFKAIRRRHWSYPKEMLLDPLRPVLRLIRRHHLLSNRRDEQLSQTLTQDWLQLPALFEALNEACLKYSHQDSDALTQLSKEQQTQLMSALEQQINRMGLSRDGLRDGGIIAAIALGQLLSKQGAVSGSAFALGAGVGSQVYLAQQSGISWLWIKFSGAPAWVSVAGGVIGILLAMMVLPFVGPFAEWLVWRWRGKRIMRDYLTQVREDLLKPKYNGEDAASVLAQYAQWLPDALAILRLS